MRIRLIGTLLVILLSGGFSAQAQFIKNFYKDIEVFGGIGTSSYFGDIGGQDSQITGIPAIFDNLDIDFWQARGMFTVGGRANPYKDLALSLQLSPIWLSGNDLRSNHAARGYSFNTSIWEGSLLAEYYYAKRMTGFAPFIFGGTSAMLYSYKSSSMEKRSKWYNGISMIVGTGLRFPAKKRLTHSLDLSFHFTTTDQLDGYRTEKNSKDLFFILSYKFNFQLYTIWYYDHKGLVR